MSLSKAQPTSLIINLITLNMYDEPAPSAGLATAVGVLRYPV